MNVGYTGVVIWMVEIVLVGSVELVIRGLTVETGVCKVGFAVERLGEHSERFVALDSLWTCLYLHLCPYLHCPCLVYNKQMG